MAQTDARAGFRLPWNTERSNSEQTETDVEHAEAVQAETEQVDGPAADAQWGTAEHGASTDPETPTGEAEYEAPTAVIDEATETATSEAAASNAPRKPQSKFMTDLTKAMQVAAEEARTRTLTQFQAEAKAHVEQIHARSATEAADLRRNADDDVAAVRDWSKAEIARVREETEGRITARKGRLETEIEGHGEMIGREIELVQGRVNNFEEEMAAFFTRLLAEEDPTHFATMAERLPEPPPFDDMTAASYADFAPAEAVETETVEADATDVVADVETEETPGEAEETPGEAEETPGEAEETPGEAEAQVEGTVETVEDEASADVVEGEAVVEPAAEVETEDATGQADDGQGGEPFEMDRESAFAAIQAAAEAAASAEVATDAAERAEAVADVAIGIAGHHEDDSADPHNLRVAALGTSPDFDAAEAEAAQAADSGSGETEEIPEIGDDALAARLAGLVPGKGGEKSRSSESKSTQVIVVGLVSVASIASFKRHLGRLPGVQSVGVSSGPDGEFLFAVNHSADVVLRDAIPSMPSFQARVTGSGDGHLNVSAHDPESDN
jgi:hypothetical protein